MSQSLRNNVFVLFDKTTNRFHIADYLLGYEDGKERWIELHESSLFNCVERELIRLGEAENVTEMSKKRTVGNCDDYRVTYNRAVGGNA